MISWRTDGGLDRGNLAYLAPRLIAGSALAGFGLAFGRDIYKGTKKGIFLILFLLLAGLSLFGAFLSGLWLTRNQRHALARALCLLSTLPIFCASFLALFFALSALQPFVILIVQLVSGDAPARTAPIILALQAFDSEICLLSKLADAMSISLGSDACSAPSQFLAPETQTILAITVLLSHFLLASGGLLGAFQRGSRKRAWNAQAHNLRFLAEHGIENNRDGTYTDNDRNTFRVVHVTPRHIELFAIGRRNRRAYLILDEQGRFTEWTGLVTKA